MAHSCIQDHYSVSIKTANDDKELISTCDALISIGGDGTFLSVAHIAKFAELPIIGINLGGLGFLAELDPNEIESSLQKLIDGNYFLTKRNVLTATLIRSDEAPKTFHAVNDVFINRHDRPKLTSISAWYNDEFITDFTGDGIIVSTPVGSTAYSLAAGGPIVRPDMEAFLLTPLTPHSLTERPIILPATGTIRLVISEKNPDLLLSADGLESVLLKSGDEILISYCELAVRIIQIEKDAYFKTLRTKLNWGMNIRKTGDE